MSQTTTGTVDVTNGSAIVVGTGTSWLTTVSAGDGFTIVDSAVTYTVASVTDDTHLNLSTTYTGTTATGQYYAIFRDFTSPDNIPELNKGDIETATVITRAFRKIQDILTSFAVGAKAFTNVLITGGNATGLSSLSVAANSSGNVSREAMTTALATANYYSDLATINLGSADNSEVTLQLLLTSGEGANRCTALVDVTAVQSAAIDTTESKIQVLSIGDTANVDYNDFFLAASATTKGTAIHFWMQSKAAVKWKVQELSRYIGGNVNSSTPVSYNDAATWTATDPLTGPPAVAITSDWAGSGWITPTLLNGWVGTSVAYRKDAMGNVEFRGQLSNGTAGLPMFNVPPGYRVTIIGKNFNIYQNSSTANNRLLVSTNGDIIPTPSLATTNFIDISVVRYLAEG